MSEKSGKVKKTIVHHYPGGDTDTLIILEDDSKIIYSAVAPVPRGHDITATGKATTSALAMNSLHPKYFSKTGLPKGRLAQSESEFFLFSPTDAVLSSKEIRDNTDSIIYQEK